MAASRDLSSTGISLSRIRVLEGCRLCSGCITTSSDPKNKLKKLPVPCTFNNKYKKLSSTIGDKEGLRAVLRIGILLCFVFNVGTGTPCKICGNRLNKNFPV